MKLEQTEDELILRDARGCSRLFGILILAVVGSVLYNNSDRLIDDGAPLGISPFALAVGGVGSAFLLFNFLPFVKTTTRANRSERRVTIERISPLGKKVAVYEFDKIRRFETVENSRSDDNFLSYYYEIVSILIDGTHAAPSNSRTSNRARCDEIVRTLNDFVGAKAT